MQDVWDPKLIRKINQFAARKDREFPELRRLNHWYDYQPTHIHRSFGETKRGAR